MKKYLLALSLFSVGNQKGMSMNNNLQAVILAAGKATRFNTEKTKLAHTICGQEMILFSTKLLTTLHIPTTVVVGHQQDVVKNIITGEHGNAITFVLQETQKGTGHAVACTQELWNSDHILVMNGDMPFVQAETIESLYKKHINNNAAISFVTSFDSDETAKSYGRIIVSGNTISIIEAKDFTGNINDQYSVNAGIYLINKNFLQNYITELNTSNASQEFYITDLVKIASDNNLTVTTVDAQFDTIRGINTLRELSMAEQIKQTELINYWMTQGVRFTSPQNVYLDLDVTIGKGSIIGNGVHLRGTTSIGKNCMVQEFSCLENAILEDNITIYSHSVITNSYVKSHAEIGPFAHLRSNVTIGEQCAIGNFVEIKNSSLDAKTKAKHLTYIGDSTVGSNVNIGAGTITCNYDGAHKHRTTIKNNAFIGSNNTLVAPVTVGDGAFTAAGSTITANVPDNALAIARTHQTNKNEYAKKLNYKTAEPITDDKTKLDVFSFIGARVIYHNNSEDEQ